MSTKILPLQLPSAEPAVWEAPDSMLDRIKGGGLSDRRLGSFRMMKAAMYSQCMRGMCNMVALWAGQRFRLF